MNKYVILICCLLLLAACSPKTESLTGAAVALPTAWNGEVKEFTVKAYRFGFDPGMLIVNKGDKVKLSAYTVDVPHGIYISGYNVNVALYGQEPVIAEFIADKEGEFPFYCSIACGAGHGTMRGVLVVNP